MARVVMLNFYDGRRQGVVMDADALIAEIATRHGVAVSRDDPVMIPPP